VFYRVLVAVTVVLLIATAYFVVTEMRYRSCLDLAKSNATDVVERDCKRNLFDPGP
jgi:hypothetical protein